MSGERVLDAQLTARMIVVRHDRVALELTELLGQHLLSNASDLPLQLTVTLRPLLQVVKDYRLPLSADDVDRRLDGTLLERHVFHL